VQQCHTQGCAGECERCRGLLASVKYRTMACAKMLTVVTILNKSITFFL